MAKRQNRTECWSTRTFTLTDTEVAEQGKLCCIDTSTGKAVAGTVDTGLVPVGTFMESKTASGDEPIKVKLFREVTVIWWENSGSNAVTSAMLLGPCYVEDSETVSSDDSGTSLAGRVWAVDSALGVAVEHGVIGLQGIQGEPGV
ncbi:MAG: hypothetical protein H6718_04155 [Polyangiaceae bacterium]|nr:hypothetical protein [Polyangiaceae bacterium]